MVLQYLPLLVATALLVLAVLAPTVRPLDRGLNRLAHGLFEGRDVDVNARRERILRSAGNGTPYRIYVTKTYLLTSIGAFCGAVFGIYLGALVVKLLGPTLFALPVGEGIFRPLPEALKTREVKETALTLTTALSLGGLTAFGVYVVRWQIPAIRADTRRRQIDAGMPRMVAFIYALSRGGMSFPDVMRALSRNRGVFGTGADEVRVGVRNIDLFGDDLISAVRDLARRTPSEQFQKFSENLTSVLQSGQNLSDFLHDEYERYRAAAEEQQREILDLLATTAEIYVTVVVAGMLFLITILLVIGLTSGGMIGLIQLITYVVLPATNVLFLAYLAEITQPLRATREQLEPEEEGVLAEQGSLLVGGESPRTDGGLRARASDAEQAVNRGRLRAYERVRSLRDTLANPVDAIVNDPTLVLYVTVPVAVAFLVSQFPSAVTDGGFDIRFYDDVVIQSVLFVLATFAIAYEVSQRRLERQEESVPDLLERLASLNEAGVAVVSSFDRVRQSDLGGLNEEVDRIWRDIQWGASVERALDRFERRVQTPAVTRVVTLITNAMRASNEIGPVLRIAAEQARNDRRLKRQRQQEMFTYLIIIYVAFMVFLVVIGAIDYVLIPSLPETSPGAGTGQMVTAPAVISIGDVNTEAYRLVFFHAGIIQAAMSGLVGGQMGGGSIRDGVKHAAIMLAIAYVTFLLLADVSTAGQFATAFIAP